MSNMIAIVLFCPLACYHKEFKDKDEMPIASPSFVGDIDISDVVWSNMDGITFDGK